MTILTDDYINTIFSIFADAQDPKWARLDLGAPPSSWGEDFFGVARPLGQQIGEGIGLPLSTSRFSQFSPGLQVGVISSSISSFLLMCPCNVGTTYLYVILYTFVVYFIRRSSMVHLLLSLQI